MIEAFSKLSQYRIDKLFPITWLKILKVFQSLSDLTLSQKSPYDIIENCFRLMLTAAFEKSEEPLGVFYMLKCMKQIIVKIDSNIMYIASESFRELFERSLKYLVTKTPAPPAANEKQV
jgi:hypothetical protein